MKSIIQTGVLVLCLLMAGCSQEGEPTVEEKMEQKGHQAAEEIKSTLEKAQIAGQLQEDHNRAIEEATKDE